MVPPSLPNDLFAHYLTTHGISYHISCPHNPQHNGLVERKIRHITKIYIILLLHASLPKKFWFDAFTTVVYLIKLLPTPILLHKSPFEALYHTPPSLSHLKFLVALVFPFLVSPRLINLNPNPYLVFSLAILHSQRISVL